MPLEKATHPHIDPRQPRDGSVIRTNPPVFAWKAERKSSSRKFRLIVATDKRMEKVVLDKRGLADPVFLPTRALKRGTYFWRWSTGNQKSEIHTFRVPGNAVVLEVPEARAWLKHFSGEHPRFLFSEKPSPATLAGLEKEKPEMVRVLKDSAERLLAQPHHMAEPPYKPDREIDYQKYRKVQYRVMWGSRKFANGAQILALAYALTGRKELGKAAARRLASLAKWDPYGSTHLEANDEPHMSILWYGAIAADWCWDCFTDKQRSSVLEQMKARAAITFEYMHDRGQYGIERFDSHAGRETIFLANLLLIFHDHIPEAEDRLNWLRPILCGIWPVWAGDDGAWAEGISYSTPYVDVMTLFASALKRTTGIDLYRRPFWKNFPRWKMTHMPHYAEWIGFGDHTEAWATTWRRNADSLDLIARETGTSEFDGYVQQLRRETLSMPEASSERALVPLSPQLLLCPETAKKPASGKSKSGDAVLYSFSGAGWAAFRTDMQKASRDIALIFRSSPYGSISHSHANNNDFIIHAGGIVLAMPSGYYAGYGSPHHAHWVWHTQSHNCVTLSGAPQLLRSPASRGELLSPREDGQLAYVLGNADESYQDRARHCRRHVLFFKRSNLFLMLDDFQALPEMVSSFQWNIHSWAQFKVKKSRHEFSLTRKKATLTGMILSHKDGFFSLSEGWDPPFASGVKSNRQWLNQYHLRFTPTAYRDQVRLGVLLIPETRDLRPPAVQTWIENNVEIAEFDSTRIEVFPPESKIGKRILARIRVGRQSYHLTRSGIRKQSN